MTYDEAAAWIRRTTDDDDAAEEDLSAAFRVIYGREADARDRLDGVWSLLCAAVEEAPID